jgi:multicomponent Na+:H+ antiporter subunit A
MTVLLAAYGVTGVALVVWGARLGRSALVVGAVVPLASTVWALAQIGHVTDGDVAAQSFSWVGALDLSFDLRLDGLAETMTLIVAGIGVLVMVYAVGYFSPETRDLGRLAGLVVLFAGAMVGIVQADHLLLLYACWEVTSVTSYLLIGNEHTNPAARAAALQALLVTSAGGLAMLGGFVLLGQEAGTYRFSELLSAPAPTGALATTAVVLVLVGAFTKSAQYPFHSWLPGAMAAPTPVSAYLHSATMVTAGVFLVARLAPVFADLWLWRPLVLGVGVVTFVAGGVRALRQTDLKLLLAFGTVSQLGLMMALCGAGTPEALTAGWELLVAHAVFKAALFMVVGILDKQTGTRDIRELPALGGRRWWWIEAATIVSAASMAGFPLSAGFIAKEEAYGALADAPFRGADLVLAALVAGSMLTVAYAWRFWWGTFVAPRRRRQHRAPRAEPTLAAVFTAPALVLAATSLALGLAPGLGDRLATAAVRGVGFSDASVHLELWHGLNLPLVLSAVALAGGAVLVAANERIQPVLAAGRSMPSGDDAYLLSLRAIEAVSGRVTGVVQNGSLPVYAGVTLAAAAVLPAGAALADWSWPGWPEAGSLGDLPVTALLVSAALGAAIVRRRFSAAVFLGVAGYAMAGLFVLFGAPDLALTQVVVETLTTVVFVLVLRRLPEEFERQSTPRRRVVRLTIAALVGVTVFGFGLLAGGVRTAPPVSDEMIARSVPDGHGRNVVNVILVDFRGFDTLGEITVLTTASIGAVALARAGRPPRHLRTGDPAMADSGETTRIVFVDVSVEIIFYAVFVASIWLLFAGHNQPGGGFVGGLLAGAAITLRYVAGGMRELRARSRFRPWAVLGTGLLLAGATATYPLLRGRGVLESATGSLNLPLVGDLTLSTALVFDIGVYVTVVGVVLMAFEAFGDEPVPEQR